MFHLAAGSDGEMGALCHLLVDVVTTAADLMKEVSTQLVSNSEIPLVSHYFIKNGHCMHQYGYY